MSNYTFEGEEVRSGIRKVISGDKYSQRLCDTLAKGERHGVTLESFGDVALFLRISGSRDFDSVLEKYEQDEFEPSVRKIMGAINHAAEEEFEYEFNREDSDDLEIFFNLIS